MLKVCLKKGREYSAMHFHPWIFSGAIERTEGEGVNGGLVQVFDNGGKCIGWGNHSPESMIRVRMLSHDASVVPNGEYVKTLVKAAIRKRGNAIAAANCGARLIHGESDYLPGVTADVYDGWCVAQLSSAGAEYWKEAITEALMESGARGVYDRSDVDSRAHEGLEAHVGNLAGEEPPEAIEIHEGAIRYLVDVRKGHKTGFYLDQRDARAMVGSMADGCEVLNCFSYTGGFGLACKAGGATSTVNLDLSQPALDLARRNYELSFGNADNAEFVCADVFTQLRLYRDMGRKFDLIVLDPPKFADTKSRLVKAMRGYKDINLLAMKLLNPGGILATFSCSGAMTQDLFDTVCREAAFDAKRRFQVVTRTRQAADHPVALDFPEGFYLKGLIMRAE